MYADVVVVMTCCRLCRYWEAGQGGDGMEEDGPGPIATNRRPDFRARMHMMPNSSWMVMLARSCSNSCSCSSVCDGRAWLEVGGRDEEMSSEVVGWNGW